MPYFAKAIFHKFHLETTIETGEMRCTPIRIETYFLRRIVELTHRKQI